MTFRKFTATKLFPLSAEIISFARQPENFEPRNTFAVKIYALQDRFLVARTCCFFAAKVGGEVPNVAVSEKLSENVAGFPFVSRKRCQ